MTRRERNHSKRSSKRALTGSILAIVLCVVLLAGATFAWFTDTASTKVSKIESGTLKIDLTDADGNSVKGTTLNFVKAEGHEKEAVLWEPGAEYSLQPLTIKNVGSLALKYRVEVLGITASGEEAKLNEAIDWTITAGTDEKNVTGETGVYWLAPNETATLTISGKMQETAGNEYQGLTIENAAINIVATQYTYEYDSNGNTYDAGATLPSIWDGESKQAPAKDSEGVYQINNAAEFVSFITTIDHGNDNPYTNSTVVLNCDIDLAGNTITAATQRCADGLKFDGQGHTVSNFTLTSTSDYYCGLFGYFAGYNTSYIKNVTVTNATVSGGKQVGVIVGATNNTNSTVENCKVYNCTVVGAKKVGAVVGYTASGYVKDCYAENCTVICAENDVNEAGEVVGFINTVDAGQVDNTSGNSFKNVTVITGGNVTIVSNATELANAIQAGGTVLLTKDITVDSWTTVCLKNKDLTIKGNNKTITGLNAPLLNFYGGTCTISDLTVKNSTVAANTGTDVLGAGVILEQAQWANLYMDNCHVINSSVTGGDTRAAALVGYWIGGGEIKNCSAEGCEVSVQGTVGGIVGHRQIQDGYVETATITNCSAKNCTLTSNDNSYRVGAIIGTVSQGTTTISGCTSTGNTIKQMNGTDEITRPDSQSDLYGRTASNGTVTVN